MLHTFDQFIKESHLSNTPPNYRKAEGNKTCGNCGAFHNKDYSTGYCEMFNVQVKENYTCDDWMNEQQWQQHINENEKIKQDCDCCNYFDFETIFQQYNCIEKPLYFLIYKGTQCRLITMSPDSYLKESAKSMNLDYDTFTNEYSYELVIQYKNNMENGAKFPIPFYSINTGKQEGRHRALAAKRLKCNSIPIVEIKELNPKEIKSWVEFFKEMSEQQINQYFQDEFNLYGITKLGLSDLNRKIEQNK